jgi:hypothetical protein
VLEQQSPEPDSQPEQEPAAAFTSGYPDAADEVEEDAIRARDL